MLQERPLHSRGDDKQPSGEYDREDQESVLSMCDLGHLLHRVLCGVACVEM